MLVLITATLEPLNHLACIFVYGAVPYVLGAPYDILAAFITSYDLRSYYEKARPILELWGVSLNTEILFG
jgi:hypothetical protein